jgi:hypothetical protein
VACAPPRPFLPNRQVPLTSHAFKHSRKEAGMYSRPRTCNNTCEAFCVLFTDAGLIHHGASKTATQPYVLLPPFEAQIVAAGDKTPVRIGT